jgi:hypothetical protein
VPVLIRNFYDKTGDQPNADDSAESGWRLVRRFFIYDTISGVEGDGNYNAGKVSSVVRYPLSIQLRITLDPDYPEMIYPPLLIITYRERALTVIE